MALILCNGMNRSGSTLQYNMARLIVEKSDAGCGESFVAGEALADRLSQLEAWAADGKIHVLKTHDLPPAARHLWENGSLRLLYIYRDIRDVAASMKRIWNYEGEQLLCALDQAIETYGAMRQMPRGVLWQKYEAVMSNHQQAVREIAAFLQVELNDEQVQEIARECSVDKMRRVQDDHKKKFTEQKARSRRLAPLRRLLKKFGIEVANGKTSKFDPVTALHPDHIGENAGAVGSWKSVLSNEEGNLITQRYERWLREEGYLDAA